MPIYLKKAVIATTTESSANLRRLGMVDDITWYHHMRQVFGNFFLKKKWYHISCRIPLSDNSLGVSEYKMEFCSRFRLCTNAIFVLASVFHSQQHRQREILTQMSTHGIRLIEESG
jgi:hypothetical protein